MKRPLIIGYGNPLREDDGIGWYAANLVERMLRRGAAEIIRCHQLTPELAARIKDASLVIFLDAAVDQEPGSAACRKLHARPFSAASHHLTPEQLISLAAQLKSAVPHSFWITGGALATGWREGLSPYGEQAATKMARQALRVIEQQKPDLAIAHSG